MELFFCMCCHMCLQMTSLCKSCNTLFAAKCIFFIMYTCIGGKYCTTLLAIFFIFFLLSGMCCHMCLQMTSLCKSCTTLFAAKCLFFIMYTCIRGKYCPPLFTNPAPHSLQITGFHSACFLRMTLELIVP